MIDLDRTYDGVVCGAGFAGLAAAVAIRRRGFSVLLVEPRSAIAWEATRAYRLDWRDTHSEFGQALAARLAEKRGLAHGRLDAPICELVIDEMLAEARVDLLLLARTVGLGIDDGAVRSVQVASKSGEKTVRARAVVDGTRNAFLWTRSGGTLTDAPGQAGIFTAFLNGADQVPDEPRVLGDLAGVSGVVLRPSVWPGEVAAEYEVASGDISQARLALPEFLRALRRAVPELAGAMLTHAGMETFPVSWPRAEAPGCRHPRIGNLFGAGSWCTDVAESPCPADLIELGQRVGEEVADTLASLPAPQAGTVEPSVTTPPIRDAEVVVVGGGTAGAVAAIAAARGGVRTVLLEQGSSLGGVGTTGGIHLYYHGVVGGIQDELDKRVEDLSPVFLAAHACQGFHPEAKKVVLEQMAREAGVEVLYDTTLTNVETDHPESVLPAAAGSRPPSRVRAVIGATSEGNVVWRTRVLIDASGDGDAAAMAGASFIFGRETDGLPHAYSQSAGVLDARRGLRGLNFDAGYCDPTDVVDMTRARRRGLELYRLQQRAPEDRLLYIAPLLGLRNARQVVGDYQLTLADQIEGREFPDVIAYAYSHYDNHALDYENESDAAAFWVWVLGNWRRPIGCEIPYRCLLPQGVEGLLVACRALSVTQDAHFQLRMQRDLQRIGEAAGMAAVLAVRQDKPPRHIDVAQLQAELIRVGALGKPEPKALPAPSERAVVLHESAWRPAPPPALPAEQLVGALGGEKTGDTVWALVRKGRDSVPALRGALESEDSDKRYWAAAALAALGQNDGAEELARYIRERDASAVRHFLKGDGPAPRPLAAVCLLGRLGERSAVPAILDVVQDEKAPLDTLIAAVRALGRIGDPAAAPGIEAMLTRADLPTIRGLQDSGAAAQAQEDCRWQIDLAAAEALGRLGRPRPDLVQPHLSDERVLVRRHARRVLDQVQGTNARSSDGQSDTTAESG